MTASASTNVTELLIDGELIGASGGTFTTVNPATEEALGEAADADAADMGRAITAARATFDREHREHHEYLETELVAASVDL